MRINNDEKIYLTYNESLKVIAMEVIKRAVLDFQNPRYKHKGEIENFFLNGQCDFYLGFWEDLTIKGKDIYNILRGGGKNVYFKERGIY